MVQVGDHLVPLLCTYGEAAIMLGVCGRTKLSTLWLVMEEIVRDVDSRVPFSDTIM